MRQRRHRTNAIAWAAAALWAASALADDQIEYWRGTIEPPNDQVAIVVQISPPIDVEAAPDARSGYLHIPAVLGADPLAFRPLTGFGVSATSVAFDLPSSSLRFNLERSVGGNELIGAASRGSLSMPVRLQRISELEGRELTPPRPQIPVGVKPYDVEPVEVHNRDADVTLVGELTIPRGTGPFPAVLLVSDFGADTRDNSRAGHPQYLVWADALTRAGFAALRLDDRGAGDSTGDHAASTADDLAADMIAAFDFLRSHARIDPGRVGMLARSEGCTVAALAAGQRLDTAFLVMLNPHGAPGSRLMRDQLRLEWSVIGRPEQITRVVADSFGQMLDAVAQEQTERAEELAGDYVRTISQALGDLVAEDEIAEIAAAWVQFYSAPRWRHWLAADPLEAHRGVRAPTLALAGSLDRTVPPESNLSAVRNALLAGGNQSVEAEIIPGLNHLMQSAKTGLDDERYIIGETVAPQLLNRVIAWLERQTRSEAEQGSSG